MYVSVAEFAANNHKWMLRLLGLRKGDNNGIRATLLGDAATGP